MELVDQNVTVMVKTILRPGCLRRFLESVRQYYPNTDIWVADDSAKPYPEIAEGLTNIQYHVFDYDSGPGYCYNWMADRIQTPYIVTCEDDFIFSDQTRLDRWLPYLQYNLFDLMGGPVYKVRQQKLSEFVGYFPEGQQDGHFRRVYTKQVQLPIACDVVLNWHIAKTDALREAGWDPALKVARHTDFFLTAKSFGQRVGYHPGVTVLHDHQEQSRDYAMLRNYRLPEFQAKFRAKYGLSDDTHVMT